MIDRRRFFLAAGAVLSAPLLRAQSNRYHFTLGVASGSPRPDGVMLWTRLAPEPLRGGGMPVGRMQVRWRVCADPQMRQPVMDGVAETSAAKAHAVHVRLRGLQPGREYWYQFHFGEDDSPIGRTRTADPTAGSARLALASCNAWESGHFAAYADIARWAPDCVIHIGDYIYEGGIGRLGVSEREVGGRKLRFETVRLHNSAEIVTLYDYRNRYALYRSDPSLQAAHAASPWVVAMDDHEVDNNWAGETPQDPWAQTPLEFKVRKLAALQAYWEHMPIERPPVLNGIDSRLQMYDAFRFGPAQLFLLDTRQFRSDQPCDGEGFPGVAPCPELLDPHLTMTGAAQERWLVDGLQRSTARYNVIASQTWFAPYRYDAGAAEPRVNMDQWDGYPQQRQRIIDALASGVSHPVVLSGDWHCAAAMRIHQDPSDVRSRRVGHNFCGTSVSSHCSWWQPLDAARTANPHVDHVNGAQRGYLRLEAGPLDWKSDFRVVQDATQPDSKVVCDVVMSLKDT